MHGVDLAATLRRLGRASDVLVVLLVAAAPRVAAVRGEAAVLDLGAVRLRRVHVRVELAERPVDEPVRVSTWLVSVRVRVS